MLKNFCGLYNCLRNKIQTLWELTGLHGSHRICVFSPAPKVSEGTWWRCPIVRTMACPCTSLLQIILCHVPKLELLFTLLWKSFKCKFNCQILCSAIPDHDLQISASQEPCFSMRTFHKSLLKWFSLSCNVIVEKCSLVLYFLKGCVCDWDDCFFKI